MNQLQNSVQLIGNLGKAPERVGKKKGADNAMVRFSLATNESYTNKDNERVDNTQWHNCIAFGRKAEVLEEYCDKGTKLAIQGRIRYEQYEDKQGVSRMGVSIQVMEFMFLSGSKK